MNYYLFILIRFRPLVNKSILLYSLPLYNFDSKTLLRCLRLWTEFTSNENIIYIYLYYYVQYYLNHILSFRKQNKNDCGELYSPHRLITNKIINPKFIVTVKLFTFLLASIFNSFFFFFLYHIKWKMLKYVQFF